MKSVYKNADLFGDIVDIECVDGKITFVGKLPENGIDLNNYKVFPGLIDIHCHGCIGYDTMDGDHLEDMAEYLAKNGTTSWLPTTMTMSMESISKVVNIDIPHNISCNILGFHMEGPYISSKYKGAQNEAFIKPPSIEEFKRLKNIKIVTVAPEIENAMEFIKNCNAVVSLGHTDCDYECGIRAIENGAACLTHTFNAMPPLHHRNPGLIGAAIEKEIYIQVICDGLHIHKSIIKMLYKTFGADRMILISDSMCATGLADGNYIFGGQEIAVRNSVARTLEGALAGSTSVLFSCVKKAIEFGIPEKDAFKMASETPGRLLRLKKGIIEAGYDADFIVTDREYNIKKTIVNGRERIFI